MLKLSRLSDERIVEITKNKNKEAYAEIIKRYQEKLMRYIGYLINDENKTADIVQEAFIKAYINLNSFNTKLKFSSWIYRIAHNEAMNAIKKHYREKRIPDKFDYDSGINIEEEYNRKEIKEMVQKCIREIPAIYREPLSLFYLEDKSYTEISDILRLPMGTVGTRIKRAKILMKKTCQEKKK